jgi:hypothetical protein
MMINVTAKTNQGNATVSLSRGYKGALVVVFTLDIGGTFGGWSVESLMGHKHHTLCLDGGCKLDCVNIQEVMEAVKMALIAKGMENV